MSLLSRAPMANTARSRPQLYDVLSVIFLAALAFLILLPILWWVSYAVKDTAGLGPQPTLWDVWVPDRVNFIPNLEYAFSLYPLAKFFLNSFIVASAVTIFELLLASMAGYAFAKYAFKGRDLIFKLVLILLMVPQIVLIVPLFEIFVSVKMTNSYLALILPFIVTPFGIFMMRQFMYGVPDDYLEAARVEGAGEFRIFFQIVMPIMKNALATLGIVTFLMQWDSLLWPLVATSRNDMYTLSVGISLLQTNVQVPYNAIYAATLLFSIPVVVVYLFFQNQVIKSMALTGVKE
jgi:multiple sugar transport system permease protein